MSTSHSTLHRDHQLSLGSSQRKRYGAASKNEVQSEATSIWTTRFSDLLSVSGLAFILFCEIKTEMEYGWQSFPSSLKSTCCCSHRPSHDWCASPFGNRSFVSDNVDFTNANYGAPCRYKSGRTTAYACPVLCACNTKIPIHTFLWLWWGGLINCRKSHQERTRIRASPFGNRSFVSDNAHFSNANYGDHVATKAGKQLHMHVLCGLCSAHATQKWPIHTFSWLWWGGLINCRPSHQDRTRILQRTLMKYDRQAPPWLRKTE